MIVLSEEDFRVLSSWVKRTAGIVVIQDNKWTMVPRTPSDLERAQQRKGS